MERTDFARIAAFTDGVMAVAITLLVLNIETPDVAADDLGAALRALDSSFIAYVLSFALIGRFWVIHHTLFERLERFDGRLMTLNLFFLMLIALVPFCMDLVDGYSETALASAVFGLVLGLAAATNWAMTVYSMRRGFVHEDRAGELEPLGSPVALGFAALFLLSIPVAYVSVLAAQLMWASSIVLRYPLRRLARWVSR